MTKSDEFLKLDGLIKDPDVNRVIEENAITEPQTFKYEVKEEITQVKEFTAHDLPIYLKDDHTWNWMVKFFKVSIRKGKLHIEQITKATYNVDEWSYGKTDMQTAFHKDNKKISESDWKEVLNQLNNYINYE